MTIDEIIAEKGIDELLHFTTNEGLLGILASGVILSRERLPEEKYLEHVYSPNAVIRRDLAWLDYVNLSISRINEVFFRTAARWHRSRDVWWCAIGVDPILLTHENVVFATTNNIYSGVRRGQGAEGLGALFADVITQWSGNVVKREPDLPPKCPTCIQAEVLYPEAVPREHFRRIYVPSERAADIVGAQILVLEEGRYSDLPVLLNPALDAA